MQPELVTAPLAAPSDAPAGAAVDPRVEIARLTLRLRQAQRRIDEASEVAAVDLPSARSSLVERLGPMLDERRAELEAELAAVRAEASTLVDAATRDAASIVRQAELHVAEQRLAEQRLVEQRLVEQVATQQHIAEQQLAEQRAAEQRAAELAAAEQRAAELRAAEVAAAELAAAEQRAAEQAAAELAAAEQAAAEQAAAEQAAAERYLAEQRALELRASENHAAEQRRVREHLDLSGSLDEELHNGAETDIWAASNGRLRRSTDRGRRADDASSRQVIDIGRVREADVPTGQIPIVLADSPLTDAASPWAPSAAVVPTAPAVPTETRLVVDAEAFAQVFATTIASIMREWSPGQPGQQGPALQQGVHQPAFAPGIQYVAAPHQVIAHPVAAPATSGGFWANARHLDVLLLGLTTAIVLVVLAAWLA